MSTRLGCLFEKKKKNIYIYIYIYISFFVCIDIKNKF